MCMMWCVENDPYVEYTEVEEFQDLEKQALVEGKSLLHSL
jgi:hypothetical protein